MGHIAFTDDQWGGLGQMLLDNGTDWIGHFTCSDTQSEDVWGTPYLGCNEDRITHFAKRVIGIQMDGATFIRPEIYNLYKVTELGSGICDEYREPNRLTSCCVTDYTGDQEVGALYYEMTTSCCVM